MKKIFYIGVLSTLILNACSEEKAESKEKTVNSYTEEVSQKNPIDEEAKELQKIYTVG